MWCRETNYGSVKYSWASGTFRRMLAGRFAIKASTIFSNWRWRRLFHWYIMNNSYEFSSAHGKDNHWVIQSLGIFNQVDQLWVIRFEGSLDQFKKQHFSRSKWLHHCAKSCRNLCILLEQSWVLWAKYGNYIGDCVLQKHGDPWDRFAEDIKEGNIRGQHDICNIMNVNDMFLSPFDIEIE